METAEQSLARFDETERTRYRSRSAALAAVAVLGRSRTALVGVVIVVMLVAGAASAPWLAPSSPTVGTLRDRTQPPSREHLLGTDQLGRDILSRILWGARLSLFLGIGATGLALIVGSAAGLVAGYEGGLLESLSMRAVDILLAFPLYLVALIVIAILGPSFTNTVFAVAIATTPTFARLARGETLALRDREYVDAARALGVPRTRILYRHILPNIISPLMVVASLAVGNAILVEASLSFLGLGPSPPTPSWGLMINDGLQVLRSAFWVPLFPGLAITITVLGFNLLGDGIRDALDPRQRSA